jgi:hypothetical protein
MDGLTVPEDQPFPYAKSKLGYDVMAPPAHGNCTCTLEYRGEALRRSLMPTMPQMPGMGMPGMGMMPGMMPMMPDPQDVETFEGVQSLIRRMGSVKDLELMEIGSKIWGDGYNYEGKTPLQARAEILGFLLDQRDLLGIEPDLIAMPDLQPSPSLPVKDPQGSTNYSTGLQAAAPAVALEGSSLDAGSSPPLSTNSLQQDSSQNPLNKPYGGTK